MRLFVFLLMMGFVPLKAHAIEAPDDVISALKAGQSVKLIVEYDDAPVELSVATKLRSKQLSSKEDAVISYKSQQYKSIKDKIDKSTVIAKLVKAGDIENIKDYSHLPLNFKRVGTYDALTTLLSQTGVKAVYEDRPLYPVLASSLPFINQPTVANAGLQGDGKTVVVLDTGVDIANPAFGACTSANTPSNNCRVVVNNNIASSPYADHSHGTNVSAVVLGVAPRSKIAMLNVFDTAGSASSSDILTGIDWSISNKVTYDIVAVNLSLGDGQPYSSQCPRNTAGGWASTAITRAKNAGIAVVVAAGNEARQSALASPACSPDAISVGAVYDSNIGGVGFSNCSDNTTAPDQITCFSNRADYMTLFAPGGSITAGGITQFGTSQASPHVAGAIAILRAAYPSETVAQTLARLTSNGTPITFNANGVNVTKPRLNLLNVTGTVTPPANADLSIGITGTNSITLNTNNDYTLTVTNAGPQPATSVVATATLPAGASYVSASAGCSATSNVVTCSQSSLAANSTIAFTFRVRWNSFSAGSALQADVSSAVADSNTANNSSSLNLSLAPPANNNFANAVTLSGNAGSITATTLNANKEIGEPNHAGDTGGASIWWKWTAPASGDLLLNTEGSEFDTLLAAYTGNAVNALALVASNDDANPSVTVSSLSMSVVANQTYYFAVDGFSGQSGAVQLNWSLTPSTSSANADLSIGISGTNAITLNTNNDYTLTVSNAGPQSATSMVATATLPAGASYVSASAGCSAASNVVTCSQSSLAANSTIAFTFRVRWNSFSAGSALQTNVSSAVADSNTANNSSSLSLSLASPPDDGDVPLPLWALMMMFALSCAILAGVGRRFQR